MAPRAKKPKIEKPLTEVELEMMNAVWSLGDCTVKDVQNQLSKERDLAYTSVATIMKILEQKGFLKSQAGERAHSYKSQISKSEYESLCLKHLATTLFEGDPSSMVMRLLNDSKMSEDELRSIRSLLDRRLKS
jgi:predicted transcriptional regulator